MGVGPPTATGFCDAAIAATLWGEAPSGVDRAIAVRTLSPVIFRRRRKRSGEGVLGSVGPDLDPSLQYRKYTYDLQGSDVGPRAVSGLRAWRFSGAAPGDSPDTEVVRVVLETGPVHRRHALSRMPPSGTPRHAHVDAHAGVSMGIEQVRGRALPREGSGAARATSGHWSPPATRASLPPGPAVSREGAGWTPGSNPPGR